MNYLETERIRLRAPEPYDLDSLYLWENDTSLWSVGNTLVPYSRYVLEKYLLTAHLDLFEAQQLRLMIDFKPDKNRLVGSIDLFDYDVKNQRAGVGILIADEADRGKHLAFEALELLCEYAFKALAIKQLYCNVAVDNVASLMLFSKAGFETVGIKKQWTRRELTWVDEYFMQRINPYRS